MIRLIEIAHFEHQVTGVTVSPDNRVFVNFPRWTDEAPTSVAEILADGTVRAYPDEKRNAWRNAKANEMEVEEHFVCVQSVVADRHGALWALEPAAPANEKILPGGLKLVRIDLAGDNVTQVITFAPDVALQGTYFNDIRLSPDGQKGYITDSGTRGAIIVVDLQSGESFRALDGHPSTQLKKDVVLEVDGAQLRAVLFAPDSLEPSSALMAAIVKSAILHGSTSGRHAR